MIAEDPFTIEGMVLTLEGSWDCGVLGALWGSGCPSSSRRMSCSGFGGSGLAGIWEGGGGLPTVDDINPALC